MKPFLRSLLPGLAFTFAIIGVIVTILGARAAVTSWWRIPLLALIVALCVTRFGSSGFTHILSGFGGKTLRRIAAVFIALGISGGVLTAINFYPRPGAATVEVRCEITRLYRTTHHHTKRVGRHYVSTGSVYYRYHADVRLPSGQIKDCPIVESRYRRLHRGDSLSVEIHPGLLGTDFFTPAASRQSSR